MTPELKDALIKAIEPITRRVRTDVTAAKFSSGMAWTKEPLTPGRLAEHVNGGPARGVCPIKEGQSVTMVAVLDFDSHGGETDWPGMQDAAGNVGADLMAYGYQPVAFRSAGGRGVHLYLLWDEPQDAYSVRAELERILELGGFKNGAKGVAARQVEIFPKQDSVGMGEMGNQFILPLAGKSEPLDWLMGLEPAGREAAIGMTWPSSKPVPVREAPKREVALLGKNVEPIAKVRDALMSIPNDDLLGPDYDGFRDIVFAVHEATGGSEEGFDVLEEWAQQNPRHDVKFLRDRVWEYVKDADNRTRAITRATLFKTANMSGWHEVTTADGFDDMPVTRVEPDAEQAPEPEPYPNFVRSAKGRITATVGNLVLALRREDITGVQIAHDRFRDEIMLAEPGTTSWRAFGDADYVWLRERLEKGGNGFDPIGKEMIRDVVQAVANERSFDSAILWLGKLPWDGTARCETFLSDHFGVEDTAYHRAVSLYWWTAMAGRVMEPGCKADMAPILAGPQGAGKSTAIAALVPAPEFFVEVSFQEKDDDLARKMRGRLVAEIGELRGMATKELEAIKAFISRTHENWIPKFREFGTSFARRLIFIGSTNKDQFLADETGNRRWLPVTVGTIDVAAVRAAAPLLWAEARELFLKQGVAYQEAQRLADAIHEQYTFRDSWQDVVNRWLDTPEFEADPPRTRSHLTTTQVLTGALQFDQKQIGRKEEMRMAAVLKELGYFRRKVRIENRTMWAFVPTSTLENDGGN